MNFELGADIIQKTDQCKENFSCLSGKKSCICEPEQMFGSSLLIIKGKNYKECNYRGSFGYAYYCTCPSRMEIYKSYNI